MVLVDALRFDQIADEARRSRVAPTLDRLVTHGLLARVTTNSHTTKFAMPSLFSQSYPLDYGGYNEGIAARPRSFVEVLRDNGYHTIGAFSHDLNGPTANYERGFDDFNVVYDRRLAIRNYIEHVLSYHVSRWQSGDLDTEAATKIIQNGFAKVIAHCAENWHRPSGVSARPILRRNRERWSRRFAAELALIKREPETVLHKLVTIPAHFYADFAGRRGPDATMRWRMRGGTVVARLQRQLRRLSWYQFQLLPYRVPAVAGEMLSLVCRQIEAARAPWFAYVHLMDVHDARQVNRPLNLIGKLLRFGRTCRRARLSSDVPVPFGTDLALRYVDHEMARLLRQLERGGMLDNTLIMVTADHGNGWDGARDSNLAADFGFRTHYDHLNVPLIIAPPKTSGPIDREQAAGLFDSMSVSATILDLLAIDTDPRFKGASIFRHGREHVISENSGRGNCDPQHRDLYFTVTSSTHKLMAILEGNRLKAQRLYDLVDDSRELVNIIDRDGSGEHVNRLLGALVEARRELLKARGAVPASSCSDAPE
jgi:PAS domain-containing protein